MMSFLSVCWRLCRRQPTEQFLKFNLSMATTIYYGESQDFSLIEQAIRERHSYMAFQDPDKISQAFRLISWLNSRIVCICDRLPGTSGGWIMDIRGFQVWLSAARGLTRAQRREALAVLSGRSEGEASKAAIELGVDEARRCPHCASEGAVSRGMARGLRRYQCKGCGRTFKQPLSGLQQFLKFNLSMATTIYYGESQDSREQVSLIEQAIRERHSYMAFQDPDKISQAFRLISSIDLWGELEKQLDTPRKHLKQQLSLIVDRRNKIVHEGDLSPTFPRRPWAISANDALQAREFIKRLGHTILLVADAERCLQVS